MIFRANVFFYFHAIYVLPSVLEVRTSVSRTQADRKIDMKLMKILIYDGGGFFLFLGY